MTIAAQIGACTLASLLLGACAATLPRQLPGIDLAAPPLSGEELTGLADRMKEGDPKAADGFTARAGQVLLTPLAQRALAGDKQAQLRLGTFYETGTFVPCDLDLAKRLYSLAARSEGGTRQIYSPAVGSENFGTIITVPSGPVRPGAAGAKQRLQQMRSECGAPPRILAFPIPMFGRVRSEETDAEEAHAEDRPARTPRIFFMVLPAEQQGGQDGAGQENGTP